MTGLTRKQLMKEANVNYNLVDYLQRNGRLPYLREPNGKGTTALYHVDALKVIRAHVARQAGHPPN